MQPADRVGRRMKLQSLRVLMTVVQAGSMRKAAVELNITQPSISRSIAELEEAVGVPLLDRHQQGVEPTAYGRALLDGGAAMFDGLRQAVKQIEFLADPGAGDVRIGSGFHLAASFVSAVVAPLSLQHPRIAFHFINLESTESIHRELLARNVDLLIARKLGSTSEDRLNFELLFDDAYYVVAGAQHRLARKRRLTLADLTDEAWVLPPPQVPPGVLAQEAFRAAGHDYPRVSVVATLPDVRMRFLSTGRFLTIFPTSVLSTSTVRPDLKILPVTPHLPSVPIGIVTLKGRTLTPAAKLFIEHAREIAKPIAARRL